MVLRDCCWHTQLFTEICIVVMFLGSIIGGIVQCGQIFLSAADLYSSNVAGWLQWRDGSVLMVFTTLFIFPVSPCLPPCAADAPVTIQAARFASCDYDYIMGMTVS